MLNVQEITKMGFNPDGKNPEGARQAYELVMEHIKSRGGFTPVERFRRRQTCIKAAMAKPLPGASVDAFADGAMDVAGERIYEVVPTHVLCLQKLESPILKMIEEAAANDKNESVQDWTPEQQWEICFVFTANPHELRMLLKEHGVEALKEAAEKCCMAWKSAKLNAVVMGIFAQFQKHAQTTVRFAAELEQQAPTFFQALKSSTKPAESVGS